MAGYKYPRLVEFRDEFQERVKAGGCCRLPMTAALLIEHQTIKSKHHFSRNTRFPAINEQIRHGRTDRGTGRRKKEIISEYANRANVGTLRVRRGIPAAIAEQHWPYQLTRLYQPPHHPEPPRSVADQPRRGLEHRYQDFHPHRLTVHFRLGRPCPSAAKPDKRTFSNQEGGRAVVLTTPIPLPGRISY